MVSRDESLAGEATFKKWPLQTSSDNSSVSDQLLQMLTKDHKPSLNLDCKGCEPDSMSCTCSLTSISFENKFAIFVLLQIDHLSMTKWCPLEEIETDLFFCDAERKHKISYICDGLVLTKEDENSSTKWGSGKLENTDNKDKTNAIWKQICVTSEDIGERYKGGWRRTTRRGAR